MLVRGTTTKPHLLLVVMTGLQSHKRGGTLPFNPVRCVVFLCSYALVLSDMMRTGVAIGRMPQYKDIEPSSGMFFGPYAYSDGHVMYNDSDTKTLPVWSYKYDTTSMGIRAVAQYLNVSSWSSCLFYKTQCKGDTIGYPTVLKMFDSLVDAIDNLKSLQKAKLSSLTLRIKVAFFDRFHHYVFPFIFKYSKTRTVQAIHYDFATLSSSTFQFCGQNRVRPYSCGDIWTNYRFSCQPWKSTCVSKGLMWSHAQHRLKDLRTRYAEMQVDMLLLDAMADLSSQGVSFQGRQSYDVVIITRIRNCTIDINNPFSKTCLTVAVDDYRYEGTMFTSNVVDWFHVIGSIRFIGQAYFWLRISMLFLGCYHLRPTTQSIRHSFSLLRICSALRTMLTIPSQVAVYGGIFPIACYTVAHFLDCVVVYELVNEQFSTISGALKLKPRVFIMIASISMRSLWVLALALHVILYLRTRCCWAASSRGIPGIPEFSISTIAMLTISAQYRRISFRNTRLLTIDEVAGNAHVRMVRSVRRRFSREFLQLFFFSDMMDVKCLIASSIAVVTGLVLIWGFIRALSCLKLLRRCNFYIWPCTFPSFAADTLWPANALMVSWNGFALVPISSHSRVAIQPDVPASEKSDSDTFLGPRLRSILDSFTNSTSDSIHKAPKSAISLGERSPDVHVTIRLMNVAIMTDPVVFFGLRWFGGQTINVYALKRDPTQTFFIPVSVLNASQNVLLNWSELVFLRTLSSLEMKWDDLIRCG